MELAAILIIGKSCRAGGWKYSIVEQHWNRGDTTIIVCRETFKSAKLVPSSGDPLSRAATLLERATSAELFSIIVGTHIRAPVQSSDGKKRGGGGGGKGNLSLKEWSDDREVRSRWTNFFYILYIYIYLILYFRVIFPREKSPQRCGEERLERHGFRSRRVKTA